MSPLNHLPDKLKRLSSLNHLSKVFSPVFKTFHVLPLLLPDWFIHVLTPKHASVGLFNALS